MGNLADLLKAERVDARSLRNRLSMRLKNDSLLVITKHGQPVKVILGYNEAMDLLDMVDELSDPRTVKAVRAGRKAIVSGAAGVSLWGEKSLRLPRLTRFGSQ